MSFAPNIFPVIGIKAFKWQKHDSSTVSKLICNETTEIVWDRGRERETKIQEKKEISCKPQLRYFDFEIYLIDGEKEGGRNGRKREIESQSTQANDQEREKTIEINVNNHENEGDPKCTYR